MSDISTEIKCVFLGDSGVGKTCILNYFINGGATRDTTPTIGAAYVSKSIFVNNKSCDLMIWDTAGQEMYRGLAPMYYRNAKVAFLIFDVTSPKSLEAVSYWADELQVNAGDDIVLVVCGNKADMESERKILMEKAQEVATNLNAKYVETSAVTGAGIDRLFQIATMEALTRKASVNQPGQEVDVSQPVKKQGCC